MSLGVIAIGGWCNFRNPPNCLLDDYGKGIAFAVLVGAAVIGGVAYWFWFRRASAKALRTKRMYEGEESLMEPPSGPATGSSPRAPNRE